MDWNDIRKRAVLEQRRIVLFGRIDDDMAEYVKRSLLTVNMVSDAEALLLIDSTGGTVSIALELYDAIQSSEAPVTAVIVGDCNSAAVLPLLACQKRIALRHSTIYVHAVSFQPPEISAEQDLEAAMREMIQFSKSIVDRVDEVYSLHTKLTKEASKQLRAKGELMHSFLKSDQALELGFVTEVVDSFPAFRNGSANLL